MLGKYVLDLRSQNLWAFIVLDKDNRIVTINEKGSEYFKGLKDGDPFLDRLPWFKKAWLYDDVHKRLVKKSKDSQYFMEFMSKDEEEKLILFKDTSEFKDSPHMWCEIGESIIGVQPFVDGYNDAILITNEEGNIRVSNQNFYELSGLTHDVVINKSIFDLEKKNILPYCAIMDVIKTHQPKDSIVTLSNGKEVMMSANPIFDNDGNMIRVMAYMMDVSKINRLYKNLSCKTINKNQKDKKENIIAAFNKMNIDVNTFKSPVMQNILKLIEDIVAYDIPILMTGESGVGKTILAKGICLAKKNSLNNFVHINCSAIPANLIESELFGYEKGAFTGADKSTPGLFEVAQDGIVLLDEIGDMPLQLQSKLLNVLQEKRFYRVGGKRPIQANFEIIAATNQDLKEMIKRGRFRKDLYFRLNVMPIHIPPLRDRKEDLLIIAHNLLEDLNRRFSKDISLDEEAKSILLSYDWPGNIRELKSVLMRAAIFSDNGWINSKILLRAISGSSDLQPVERQQENREGPKLWEPGKPLKSTIVNLEAQIIKEALEVYGTTRNAAKALKVDESTITRKISRARNYA